MSETSPPTRRARKEVEEQAALPDAVEPDGEEGRLATAQLEMAAFGDHVIPYVPPAPKSPPSLAPWALLLAIAPTILAGFTPWLWPTSMR